MSETPNATLDAKGLQCPMPVIKARQEIDKIAAGEVLQILATDPGSVADFESWTKMSGHELLKSDETEGVFTYLVKKGS